VELREVWRHEAADFTTWLRDNIDVLNDVLGLTLSGAEREQSTGNFSADIVAEDDTHGVTGSLWRENGPAGLPIILGTLGTLRRRLVPAT
jgi:hypothetical protein